MNKVLLVSRVNYSVSFKYGEETFVLSPKQRTKREFEKNKLEDIDPTEIMIVK